MDTTFIAPSIGKRGVSNATYIGTTIINPTTDDTNQRTPIEEMFSDSDEKEYNPFKYMSASVFDGRTSPSVIQIINEMVPMTKNA